MCVSGKGKNWFEIIQPENLQVTSNIPIGSEVLRMPIQHNYNSLQLCPDQSRTQGHLRQLRSILAYDAEWQDLEITEQHAFSQAVKLLPEVPEVIYFGFPWATLINLLKSNRLDSNRLMSVQSSAKPLLKEKKHVITVCQHIDLPKYQNIFAEIGVTHLFWPHAGDGLDCFPEYNDIKFSLFLLPRLSYLIVRDL